MKLPPTYPLRPINGGPLNKALPKTGVWYAEAKYNGWYAHGCPAEGILFNRQNEPLSITREFDQALAIVRALPFAWLTYEALDRRHQLSRGSLVILDYPDSTKTYAQRRAYMEMVCGIAGIPLHTELNKPIPDHSVALVKPYQWGGAHQLYQEILPLCNKAMTGNLPKAIPYYEGIVAKREDSKYPFQLRSPDIDFPFWMKHRWAF